MKKQTEREKHDLEVFRQFAWNLAGVLATKRPLSKAPKVSSPPAPVEPLEQEDGKL